MNIDGKDYRALWQEGQTIHFIDQRKLPYRFEIFTARNVEDVAYAIKDMVVRGAPAIGAAAVYGMALGRKNVQRTADILRATRPTAYDLFYAVDVMIAAINAGQDAFEAASDYIEEIISQCRRIGEHGQRLIKKGMTVLTHCNAGALATVDYGTALAPLRIAHKHKKKFFVYADETRPRLQGLLTAWELHQEGIDYALIADNAAGYFMKKGDIDLVIVAADRIPTNRDFANKIGTYEKAVLAKENSIPFYVAAPVSTFDQRLKKGTDIVIEERAPAEMTTVNGTKIMPAWISVKNPAFDVTSKKYVTGYITEKGIIKK